MRKLILILLVLLCGCTSANVPSEEPQPSKETEPYTKDDPEDPQPSQQPEKAEEPFVYPIQQNNNWACNGSGISL